MEVKEQIIQEYVTKGGGFRKLADEYGISRTAICKWIMINQGNTQHAAHGKATETFPLQPCVTSGGN